MNKRAAVLVGAAMTLAAVLTACGGSSSDKAGSGEETNATADPAGELAGKTAFQVIAAARLAMGELTSARVESAAPLGDQVFTFDLQTSVDDGCRGMLRLDDGDAQIIGVGGDLWMKAEPGFWWASGRATDRPPAYTEATIAAVGDHWVDFVPTNDSFQELCHLDQLLSGMISQGLSPEATYTSAGTDEVDGEPVVVVEQQNPDGAARLFVQVEAPHYLVRVEPPGGDDLDAWSFSEFDEKVDAQRPSEDEILDRDELAARAAELALPTI